MNHRHSTWPFALVALAMLSACAAPEIRPELAVITSPIDDVWITFVEVAREQGFELESTEPSTHVLSAAKDATTVIGGTPDPHQRTPGSRRQQHHDVRVSMRPRGERSTTIEIVYTIDKVPDEVAGFALVGAVRERLGLQAR
jgi:hypothetical protein